MPKKSLEEVRKEIEALYRKAASATDAYNLAEEQAEKQSGRDRRAGAGDRRRARRGSTTLKNRAGAAARAQYRDGGLPPEAQLMLSDDPQLFLDGAGRIRQGQKATKDLLGELTRTQEDLEPYTKDASAQWKKLEANRVKQAKAKKKINAQIAAAKKLESQLEKEERERLARSWSSRPQYKAQTAWLSSGVLKEINGKASAQGKQAVAVRDGADRQAVRVGRGGPGVVRLLGADLPGLGGGGAGHPAHLAGAVAAAAAHRHQGHAPRRPDHLPRGRQPCRDVRRRRRDRARAAARAECDDRGRGLDGDPRSRTPGQVTAAGRRRTRRDADHVDA